MSSFVAAGMAAALALASPPATGGQPTPPPVQAPDTIVVTAIRPKPEAVQKFVQQLATPAGEDDRFTRWADDVCSGVVGLNRSDAEYFNDRLAEVALQVGLKVGQPGCTPNIVVVVTPDVQPLMQALSHHRYALSGFSDVGDTTSGGGRGQTFDSFINSPRPVSWWHISERVAADTGATILGGVMRTFMQGRLFARSKEELRYVLIIVDAHQMKGVELKALSNYVAMALAGSAVAGRAGRQASDDHDLVRRPRRGSYAASWDDPVGPRLSQGIVRRAR